LNRNKGDLFKNTENILKIKLLSALLRALKKFIPETPLGTLL